MAHRHPLPPVLIPSERHPATIAFAKQLATGLEDPEDHFDFETVGEVFCDLVRSKEDAIRLMSAATADLANTPQCLDMAMATLDALHSGRLGDAAIHVQHLLGAHEDPDPRSHSLWLAVTAVCDWLEREIT